VIPPVAMKLLVRLASSFDNEIVVSARKLVAVLKQDGLDLHDVAHAANAGPIMRDRDRGESPSALRARTKLKQALAEGWLDSWSEDFLEDVLARSGYLDDLSPKQLAVINKILRRIDKRANPDCPA
jgi:hypothetical protein